MNILFELEGRLNRYHELKILVSDIANYVNAMVELWRALCLEREKDSWGDDCCSSCSRPGMILHRASNHFRWKQ